MSKESFDRVNVFSRGYDTREVDEFLEKAKRAYADPTSTGMSSEELSNVVFSQARGGYSPQAVDAAIDRLSAAFVQRKRKQVVARLGEETWLNQTYDLAKSLYPRILRPAGTRFEDAQGQGYNKDEVDELVDRLGRFFDGKDRNLTAREIRNALFSSARGENAYSEAVVDVYLERASSVLTAVE